MSQTSFNFSLFGNRYFFTPKFTLITLSVVAALVAIGIAQWKVANDMYATLKLENQRLSMEPIKDDEIDKDLDLRFFSVVLEGTFDNQHPILIKNRLYQGQNGFHVLTPFKPSSSAKIILVNRGWIPENEAEKILDFGSIPDGVTISGILLAPSKSLTGSGINEKKVGWPLIVKEPDIQKIGDILKNPINPYILFLSPSSRYGFVRDWVWLKSAAGAERHKAYAKQCFMIALVLTLLFIFMNTRKE